MNILEVAKPGEYYMCREKHSILYICNPATDGRSTGWWIVRKDQDKPRIGWFLENNINGLTFTKIYEKRYPQRKSLTST